MTNMDFHMNALESVTCCVLALVTFAVFRKELLKVRDAFVSFWIPQKRKKDRDTKSKRQESNKENLPPSHTTSAESSSARVSSPLRTMQNGSLTKEVVSLSEITTKTVDEKEGMRIKSATLLPDVVSTSSTENSFGNFSSQKLDEYAGKQTDDNISLDPFPKFSDLLESSSKSSPIDTLTSSKSEEVSSDDRGFVKTVTETKHEIKGDTEVSFMKKEEQSVSQSATDSHRAPSITLDAIDLNNLISETQKKIASFTNGFKTDIPKSEVNSSLFEVKKTETTKSVTETKSTESFNSFAQKPFSSANLDSSCTGLGSLKDIVVDTKQDLAALNGGLGFTSDESSYVTTETPFGSTIVTKKKKMFSSSSFYEEPDSLYPTIEEQVDLARKIAGSLADDTNKKSKGANMFYKRLKRSTKWIHEGPEPSDESGPGTPEIQGGEPPTPDISQVPFRPSLGPPNLKLLLDSRHPLDATALRQSGMIINEHNVISPDMCHGLVKDLHSPVGKGAALFAKRKKKSEEWVVDEEKVKALMREQDRRMNVAPSPLPAYSPYSTIGRQDVKLVKTPWEAAMESPFGLCDAAFATVNPDHLANTVIRAADNKRRNSNTPSRCMSPTLPPVTPAAAQYDIYHAKAPKGWLGSGTGFDSPVSFQASPSPISMTTSSHGATSDFQNGFSSPRKMVFQNFNTVPRQWKGSTR